MSFPTTLSAGALAAFCISTGYAYDVNTYVPCLDYLHVGPANCSTPKPLWVALPSPTTPTVPSITLTLNASPTAPKPQTLDDKIDEFLKNQGKPPREFVAFYLNPTPENAMKWAYAFKEMQTRNQQITEAWTQAEQFLDKTKTAGGDVSRYASTTLPPVMPVTGPLLDWNNPEAFYGTVSGSMPDSKKHVSETVSAFTGLTAAKNMSIGGAPLTPLPTLAAPSEPVIVDQRIHISYYFSATCEYCHKFAPEFEQVLQHMGGKVEAECVDLTALAGAGEATPANIEGKVSCQWRAATPEEVTQMGIKTTPSLIIRRPGGVPFDRINGYVEGSKLEKWLTTGAQ